MANRPAGEPSSSRLSGVEGRTESLFRANLFGPFQVTRDGAFLDAAVGMGRASARTLLKWFLLNPGVRVDSIELHELLWPAGKSRSNPNRLHVTLHYLRHQLEPHLAARQPSSFIHSDRAGRYWFDFAGRWHTDVLELADLFAAGKAAERGGEIATAIAHYESLLVICGRTFLPENMFDEPFDSARAAQDIIRGQAEDRLLGLYLRGGLAHQAIPLALSVLERDPYSEVASMTIAEVSLQQGSVLAARTHLADYVNMIRREFGVDPSHAARRLWQRIREAG